MDIIFALCLTEHRRWGYILEPLLLKSLPDKDYLLVHEFVTNEHLKQYENILTETEIKIVRWISQYAEKEMVRVLFRNIPIMDFLRSLTDEMITQKIRPYIEHRLLHCFKLLLNSGIPLFHKKNAEFIYLKNKIQYDNEPAEAVFNFHYQKVDGLRYFLSVYFQDKEIALLGKNLILIVNQPSVMLLDNNLLWFKDIDSKKLIPFANKEYIAIPKDVEEKYFKTFVVENIRKFRTNVQGFSVIDEATQPIPIISLEVDLHYHPTLLLKFNYGNGRRHFHAATPPATETSLAVSKGKYSVMRFQRDSETEKKYINCLSDLGFYYADNSMFYLNKDSALSPPADQQQSLADLVEKLNALSETLIEKGFQVVQNFFSQKYFTGSVQFEVELKTDRDWFDIYAMVHFGSFSIPFISFSGHILRQERNYVLPNGEIFILPAEWMAKYAQVMLLSEQYDNNLRLDKRYFTIVNDAFENIDKKYLHSMMALCNTDEMPLFDTPEKIQATLRPYQLQGVSWLRSLHKHQLGGCLADDMGLGKTLQAITLLQSVLDEQAPIDNPQPQTGQASLIVMPSSLIHNWVNEIKRFAPHLNILKYVGTDRQNNTNFKNYHIVLTTYNILRNDTAILRKYRFLYAILDEAQYIRNPESATCQSALLIDADYYLSLSGTPIENTLIDLWTQMNFLNHGLLGNLNFFKTNFAIPIEKNNDETARIRLQRLIQPFLLRRTKQEVTPELPELTEQVQFCEMTNTQRTLYEEEKSKARNEIIESIEEQGIEKSSIRILQALSRLRQLAIHPAMIHPDYQADSGKLDQILESIHILRSEGHKTLLFSSFTKHLDIIATQLQKENIEYALLTGKTRNREDVIERFNRCGDVPFFLISLKAGGVGLNLSVADYVFLLDPWWNPAAEQQAISRAHRIGQTEKVFAYRMITADTIEEKILHLQEKKAALADIFVQSKKTFGGMTADDIVGLFT